MEKDNLEILLEDIRGKFDLVLEGHDVLRKEIRDTKEELIEKINLVDCKVETLNQKIDNFHDKLDKKIDDFHDKLDKKIDGVHDKLDKKIDDVHDKLDKKIDDVHHDLSAKIDSVAADLSAHRRDTEAHSSVYKVKEGGSAE